MRRRRRIITIGGVPHDLAPDHALRFEVVRGVLTGMLELERGAHKLGMPVGELEALVEGARRAVIRELGLIALEEAQAKTTAPY
jgi:hypothetical protein